MAGIRGELAAARSDLAASRADNVKLYEKIRYLQRFSAKHAAGNGFQVVQVDSEGISQSKVRQHHHQAPAIQHLRDRISGLCFMSATAWSQTAPRQPITCVCASLGVCWHLQGLVSNYGG